MLPLQRNRGSAFGTLVDMSREMDRLVNTVWADTAERAVQLAMPAEVVETEDEVRFDIEMPGFRLEDIELTLENNVLTITGEKKFAGGEERKESDFRLFERRYGRYQRSFTVPPTVRGDNCQARYESGVLTIRLPKAEEAKPRRIQIEGQANGRSLGDTSESAAG
jgi:HSP20 family protein